MYTTSQIETLDSLDSSEIRELVKEQFEMCDIISKIHSLGIIKINNEFEFEDANSAWFKINNTFNHESISSRKPFQWIDNITVPHYDTLIDHMKHLYKDKEFTIECEIKTKDNKTRWVMILGNRINGGGKGYICVYIDITKRKTILPKLLELKEMEWA